MNEDPRAVIVPVQKQPGMLYVESALIACDCLYEDDEKTRLRPLTKQDARDLVSMARESLGAINDYLEDINALEPSKASEAVKYRLFSMIPIAKKLEADAQLLSEHGTQDYQGMLHW
ncbi:MAG: hypothetical protein DHS20C01_14950 [marine bacterium B5-7]|nr:MAG: hypothetical protein DHS20C01_14950 [marine bacterium B5-7]